MAELKDKGKESQVEQGLALEIAPVDRARDAALTRKQDKRILPLACGIYLLCYLDRSNIGNAKTLNSTENHDLLQETGMTNKQYLDALLMFLVAYGVFEVPSNIALKKFRPSVSMPH